MTTAPTVALVYATRHGHRFHVTDTCRALVAGQILSDYDCGGCFHHDHPTIHPAQPLSPTAAVELGLTPCLACQPPAPAGVVETFGHRPFRYDGVDICQRCWTQDGRDRDTVLYPCTTASLLGLPTAGPVDTCDDCTECRDEANWSQCCAACHCCPPELRCAACRPDPEQTACAECTTPFTPEPGNTTGFCSWECFDVKPRPGAPEAFRVLMLGADTPMVRALNTPAAPTATPTPEEH